MYSGSTFPPFLSGTFWATPPPYNYLSLLVLVLFSVPYCLNSGSSEFGPPIRFWWAQQWIHTAMLPSSSQNVWVANRSAACDQVPLQSCLSGGPDFCQHTRFWGVHNS